LDGEVVRVTYQDGSHAALQVQILEGPYAGYNHVESDGLIPSWMAMFLAFALGAYGVLDWLNDGTAITVEAQSRPVPDGDVDTQSMLNLESK
jgi:hypothetical protein